jgi:hypothetical protein
MESDMKTVSWCLLLAACVFLATSVEAQKKGAQAQPKVYRWVDEKGEVHFSESLPPDLQEEKLDVQKKAGNTWQEDRTLTPPPPPKPKPPGKDELPRDSSGMQRANPRYNAAQIKAQQDDFLLLRYDSEQEILDAMQVEIKQMDYDKRVLTASRKSLDEAYHGNIREAAERQRAGVKVEDKLVRNIRSLKQRLGSNAESIGAFKEREDAIRKTFEAELERYRTLVAAKAEAED